MPRQGGTLDWGHVSGDFERQLAHRASPALIAPRIESETRRGRDYVAVTIGMAVHAADVAQAVTAAWNAFRQAARDDSAGWATASATAQVWPEE